MYEMGRLLLGTEITSTQSYYHGEKQWKLLHSFAVQYFILLICGLNVCISVSALCGGRRRASHLPRGVHAKGGGDALEPLGAGNTLPLLL